MLSLCVKLLYVKFVCVKLLYVKDKVACVREAAGGGGGRRRREEAAPGIQNQKQEPHTKLWGKRKVIHSHKGIFDVHVDRILQSSRSKVRT